jgi:hemoglobin-like flavoprotein
MGLAVETLRSSFERVIERSPNLTQRFYEVLFNKYPQTRRMFGRHSGAKQEKMLADALTAVIDNLENAPWLSSTLMGLGGKHAGYGVTDEMYAWVGDALLFTLAEAEGEDWTPDVAQAWIAAFGAIASLMQEGARRALASAA